MTKATTPTYNELNEWIRASQGSVPRRTTATGEREPAWGTGLFFPFFILTIICNSIDYVYRMGTGTTTIRMTDSAPLTGEQAQAQA